MTNKRTDQKSEPSAAELAKGKKSLKKMLETIKPYAPKADIGLPERPSDWRVSNGDHVAPKKARNALDLT